MPKKKKYAKNSSAGKSTRGKVAGRWQALDAQLSQMNPTILRSFYGGAAKFLIPRSKWSSPHPTTRADHHPIMRAFHEGFNSWDVASLSDPHMRPTLDRLRAAASFTEGERLRFKSAARRLGVLRYHMSVRLRKFVKNEPRPERGTTLYRLLMKRTWRGLSELDAETKDL